MDSPEDRQRFARRLEAFSDIVFGFALAQSAVALEVPKNLTSLLLHGADLAYFAFTFVLIAQFWVIHYRIFHYVFVGRRTDVVLNFLLLAMIGLLPYALRIWIRYPETVFGAGAYSLALGVGFALVTMLEVRGLRGLTGTMRQRWLAIAWRHGVAAAIFLFALALSPFVGLAARFAWALLLPGMLLVRRLVPAPAPAAGTAPGRSES
jgi:uncharacterized membrane protein